ncbi:MAG: HAD family hydrolase [Candidatus Cloacimonadota bacterium]|nr:HAD family hydrolase [Candidatus Cloacimonadota bacterium]
MKMFITDWDGTLYRDDTVEEKAFNLLHKLSDNKIVIVVATGRNLYSAHKVIMPNFPIDYLIFSSGAGIMNWKQKKIIRKHHMKKEDLEKIVSYLKKENLDFMVHQQLPDNHWFLYHRTQNHNPDFERRIKLYKKFKLPVANWESKASQVLAIIPNNPNIHKKIKQDFPQLNIIRTTSPLDGNSIWIEIFPKEVSKSKAAKWLCQKLKVTKSIAIGNDYNDEDLLEWSDRSYIIKSAPQALLKKYYVCENISSVLEKEFCFK